jgi:hypothetical protein
MILAAVWRVDVHRLQRIKMANKHSLEIVKA